MSALTLATNVGAAVATSPKPRLLAVDDDPSIVRAIRMLFRDAFDVTTTTDPTEAVSMLSSGKTFDLVIADQQMPKLLGVNVLEIARTISPLTGRILLTGYCESEAIVGAVNEANVTWFITKPWDVADIRAKAAQAAQPSILARQHPAPVRASVAPSDSRSYVVMVAGQIDLDRESNSLLSASTLRLASFDNVVNEIERTHVVPDVLVIAIDAQSEIHRSNLERLKSAFPHVVLVVLCDTSYALATSALVNRARPFRFLPAPPGQKMLQRAINAAIDHARELQSQPTLVEAERPAETASSSRTPLGARLRSFLGVFKYRFGMPRNTSR